MSQEKFLSEIDNFKIYLTKTKIPNEDKVQAYTLKISHIKNHSTYSRQIILLQDLPSSAQKIFTNVQDFIKAFELLLAQRKSSKNAILIWIDEQHTLNLNFTLSIMGKIKSNHLVRVQMFETINADLLQLLKRVSDLQARIDKVYEPKPEENTSLPPIVHFQSPLLDDKQRQSKKKLKEIKQTQKSSKNIDNEIKKTIFKIEDKRIMINLDNYRIQASLTTKSNNSMSITVLIYVQSTNLTYTGELSDAEIKQFLSAPTKLKNSKELFEEIRRNAKKQAKDTLKVNQRENKLEILIMLGSSSPKNQKQESIFAQIDIKPIKQQPEDHKNVNSNGHQLETSSNSPVRKQNIINQIRSSSLNDSKKDIEKSVEKSVNSIKKGQKTRQNTGYEKQFSEVSFKTKKSALPKSKDKRIQDTSFNDNSMISYNDPSVDLSLNLSYSKKNAKSAKGFLLNKQHDNFIIKEKAIQLKTKSISCALLARKIPKKNIDFQFLIRIKKITQNVIIGVASEEVGAQNNFMHQYFVGYSPLDGCAYENGLKKQDKFIPIKVLKQNSVVKVKVNVKTNKISWYLKEEDINKENWKLLKEYMMPMYITIKDLYPTVFLRNSGDKVQFVLVK